MNAIFCTMEQFSGKGRWKPYNQSLFSSNEVRKGKEWGYILGVGIKETVESDLDYSEAKNCIMLSTSAHVTTESKHMCNENINII